MAKAVSRFRPLMALVAVVALGLLSRLHPIGRSPYDKSLGDILYAVATYLVLALLFHRWRTSWVALLALVLCMAIETFQASGILARYEHITVIRWLLGTTFSWHDVACYVVGVAVAMTLDTLVLRPPYPLN
jgi:uncharacterized protein DUF2809